MKVAWSSASSASSQSFLTLAMLFGIGITTGCGSEGTPPPKFSGNTTVVVLASSSANDQLFQFSVTLQSLTLTSQSGQNISLLATPASEEFMHLNGHVEPIATTSVPQGIYTSAAATVSEALPACAGQYAGTLLVDEALTGSKESTSVSPDIWPTRKSR